MDFVIVTTVVAAATPAFQGQQPYDLVDLATVRAELDLGDTSKDSVLLRWIIEGRVLLFGTRLADHIRASGHSGRIHRPPNVR